MNHKTLARGFQWKDETAGKFRATLARFQVRDLDGDVTMPGAFQTGQEIKVAAYAHNWSVPPVGRAVIGQDQTHAWADGEFFLDTAGGMEHYLVAKRLQQSQEWSYGFEITKYDFGQFEGLESRFLRGINTFEASMVMKGAGGPLVATEFVKSGGIAPAQRAERERQARKIFWDAHMLQIEMICAEVGVKLPPSKADLRREREAFFRRNIDDVRRVLATPVRR